MLSGLVKTSPAGSSLLQPSLSPGTQAFFFLIVRDMAWKHLGVPVPLTHLPRTSGRVLAIPFCDFQLPSISPLLSLGFLDCSSVFSLLSQFPLVFVPDFLDFSNFQSNDLLC